MVPVMLFKEFIQMTTEIGKFEEMTAYVVDFEQQIDLSKHGQIKELLPTEIYMKPDGAIDNSPSYAIVCERAGEKYFIQISNKKLQDIIKAFMIDSYHKHKRDEQYL